MEIFQDLKIVSVPRWVEATVVILLAYRARISYGTEQTVPLPPGWSTNLMSTLSSELHAGAKSFDLFGRCNRIAEEPPSGYWRAFIF